MLEVHPPDHSPHNWRDFAIHIVTIVIGLLIAVMLEQGVEWLHHRHQIETARERIHEEIHVNERIIDENYRHASEIVTRLDRDIAILRAIESHQPPPAKDLDLTWNLQGYYDAAYKSAHDNGTLSLLPYDEVAMYDDCYKFSDFAFQALMKVIYQLNDTHAAMRGHTVEQLSPEEVQALITAISLAREDAQYVITTSALEKSEWEAALTGAYRNDFAGTSK